MEGQIATPAPVTAPQKAQVLFVDDEQSILTTMRIMFRRQYDVLLANNGAQALDILREKDLDVIVSDQRMPGMTGVEVLREARQIRPRAMRVLLTGYSDFSAIVGSINDGEIYRFVHKPWSNAEFQSIIEQATQSAKQVSIGEASLLNREPDEILDRPVGHRTHLLVLDSDTVAVDELRRTLVDHTLHHAVTINEALDLLDKFPIGVLIVETVVGQENVSTLLSLLKQHHPHVVSIVLTHRSDANQAIDLINQGQIFRFLLKPVRAAMTTRSVTQAVQRHETLVMHPTLTQRYKVEVPAVVPAAAAPPGAPDTVGGLLTRIRQLRGIFKQ